MAFEDMSVRKTSLPLRTAIIGLSASAVTSWAAGAHLPALLTARGKADYDITALCNSSVTAAEAAIKAFNLPPTTKPYGNPKDLAHDPDIDVVICCTRVDKHLGTVADSVRSGKKAYIEWPVTSSIQDTRELVQLAEESGSQIAVGLQGRWSPPIQTIKEVLSVGKLGKVLSSEVRAFGGSNSRDKLPTGLKYFGESAIGGNPMTIGFAHLVDSVQYVLGDFVNGGTHARTQIQIRENKTFDPQTKDIVETFNSDVPDLIIVTGTLSESAIVTGNATLSVRFRRGQPFKDEPPLTWSINCERGELRLVAPSGTSLQADAYAKPPSLQIYWFGDDFIEDIPWSWSIEQTALPVRARSVMKTLYAFAEGDSSGWTSLQSAARRAEQIDGWLMAGK